jgi:hypothetical protein
MNIQTFVMESRFATDSSVSYLTRLSNISFTANNCMAMTDHVQRCFDGFQSYLQNPAAGQYRHSRLCSRRARMDRGASSGQRVTMRNAACKAILQ